jgi:hypothetical protein
MNRTIEDASYLSDALFPYVIGSPLALIVLWLAYGGSLAMGVVAMNFLIAVLAMIIFREKRYALILLLVAFGMLALIESQTLSQDVEFIRSVHSIVVLKNYGLFLVQAFLILVSSGKPSSDRQQVRLSNREVPDE